jgi:hypothetical protein
MVFLRTLKQQQKSNKPESSKSGKIAGSSKSSGAITLPASARQHNTADLEDSGLLEMPENTLTIEQVLGTTLKETTDALVPSKSSGAITLPASARQHNTAGSLACSLAVSAVIDIR